MTETGEEGNTALYLTAMNRTEEVIQYLIDDRADRKAANFNADTPFL